MIGDLALIADGETAAVLDRDGTIVWLCWPRLDSDAAFASLLGDEDNGMWSLGPCSATQHRLSRRYLPETLILETHHGANEGEALVLDLMPARGEASDVVRIVRGLSGRLTFESHLRPRFGYGHLKPRWERHGASEVTCLRGPDAMRLQVRGAELSLDEDCTCRFDLEAGDEVTLTLTYFTSHEALPAPVDPAAALAETADRWRGWIGRCTYRGPWQEAVTRSLITMKALIYRPSGAIAAAATSSLPENPGGRRNWDYRYSWLRDATFTLLALVHAGYVEEAADWRHWLLRALGGDAGAVQPVYGLAGEVRLPEWEADWLSGYAGSRPVRFGNRAFRQRQIDIYGEVIDALFQAHRAGLKLSDDDWELMCELVHELEELHRLPDRGIWESRGPMQHFVHSQAMAWAAFDRCIRLAEAEGRKAPLDSWRKLRGDIHSAICTQGFDPERKAFTQAFGSRDLDASTLLLLHIGFLSPCDPRITGTVAAIGRELSDDGFILRYRPETGSDGIKEHEAAFLPCSFWYADALLMTGQRDEAIELFERLLAVRNDLGLLSEEYAPRNQQLNGNFPQALTHLALVNTACSLASDHGPTQQRST